MQSSYSKSLQQTLNTRQDIVLDFTNLKACLDPLAEYAAQNGGDSDERSQRTQFDYKAFLQDYLGNKSTDPFPQLTSLTIRNLTLSAGTSMEIDGSSETMFNIMQFENLVEFDISGVSIPVELQSQLQFWNMHNLKKLCMDSTDLKSVPSSIGRLRSLEVLSLNSNILSDLPTTMRFCQKLRVLNLKANKFVRIPSVVLKLANLTELRRLDNPLSQTFDIPSFGAQGVPPAQTTPSVHQPASLQRLCTGTVFANHIDYWKQECLGQMQCKTLDYLASTLYLCDHCGKVISKEYNINIVLYSYLGLRDVAFQIRTCSENCGKVLFSYYKQRNVDLQRECDEEYERSIRLAQVEAGLIPSDHAISTVVPLTTPQRRRRHKRCLIM